jgi:hypothetical protein
MKKLIRLCILIVSISNIHAQEEVQKKTDVCKCNEPTEVQIAILCYNIDEKQEVDEPGKGLSFAFEESLWRMSCAVPGVDTKEEAKLKIQCMWNKYKEKIRCYVHPTSIAVNKNVTKLGLDINNTNFIYSLVSIYNLDMNFLDPDDHKTLLDFVKEREEYIRSIKPLDAAKADEYQKTYQLLKSNGAKHNWELNKQ